MALTVGLKALDQRLKYADSRQNDEFYNEWGRDNYRSKD
jgi:hypothetical protein